MSIFRKKPIRADDFDQADVTAFIRQAMETIKNERDESEQKRMAESKEEATATGRPWVTIIDLGIDPDNPTIPQKVEMDWNEPFIELLRTAGLTGSPEEMIDRWFQDVCKHIAMESYDDDVFAERDAMTRQIRTDGKIEYQ